MTVGFGRAYYRDSVLGVGGAAGGGVGALAGATVWPYVAGTDTPYPDPLYGDESAATPLGLPLGTDPSGELVLWSDAAVRLDLDVVAPGYRAERITVDLVYPSAAPEDLSGYATDADLAAGLAAHVAHADPHPQYSSGAAADLLAHELAPDPHSVYLTAPEADGLYLPLAHAAAADPHAGYLTQAEADLLYGPLGAGGAVDSVNGQTGVVVLAAADVGALDTATANGLYEPLDSAYTKSEADGRYATPASLATAITTHEAAANPHATYLTQAEGDALYAPVGGGGGISEAAADLRYVNLTSDTMTGALTLQGATTTTNVLNGKLPADAVPRYRMDMSGKQEWGNGATYDTALSRAFTGALGVVGDFHPVTDGVPNLGATTQRWAAVFANAVSVFSDTGYCRVGATGYAGAGAVRLKIAATINWRNAANSADLTLGFQAADRFALKWGTTERLGIDTNGGVVLTPAAGTAAVTIGTTAQPKITVASSAPGSPMTGDLWIW